MRTGIILASVLMLAAVAAPSAQASPLMPAAALAGVETHDGVVLARHRVIIVKKSKRHPRHYGWIRGKHKGWYKH